MHETPSDLRRPISVTPLRLTQQMTLRCKQMILVAKQKLQANCLLGAHGLANRCLGTNMDTHRVCHTDLAPIFSHRRHLNELGTDGVKEVVH